MPSHDRRLPQFRHHTQPLPAPHIRVPGSIRAMAGKVISDLRTASQERPPLNRQDIRSMARLFRRAAEVIREHEKTRRPVSDLCHDESEVGRLAVRCIIDVVQDNDCGVSRPEDLERAAHCILGVLEGRRSRREIAEQTVCLLEHLQEYIASVAV